MEAGPRDTASCFRSQVTSSLTLHPPEIITGAFSKEQKTNFARQCANDSTAKLGTENGSEQSSAQKILSGNSGQGLFAGQKLSHAHLAE